MQIVTVSETPTTQSNHIIRKGGTIRQTLLAASEADGLDFRFIRSQYQSGDAAFESPRHHHAFQQIRFTESGTVNYAPGRYIAEGDIAYFPRGAFYGPQRKDQGVGLLFQFGYHGEHQSGLEWARHREVALELLNSRGRFEDGIYYEKDEFTGQEMARDASQAVYEQQYFAQTGKPFVIPQEGYDEPILLHPKALEYYTVSEGVRMKQLGHFFDHPGPNADIRICMVELADGASYSLNEDRAQVAWTLDAGLKVEEKTHERLICLYSPRGEALIVHANTSPADCKLVELYVLELPRLDSDEGPRYVPGNQ